MADETSRALEDLVRQAQLSDDVDFLREGVRALAHALMEVEVTQHVGASRYERSPERTGERTGSRERRWDTRVGSLTWRVPRVRDGSDVPSLLEPRRRAERALVAVVQEASIHGVSTRRVDELAHALGLTGISKRQVALIWQEVDAEVERFRTRPLSEAVYPSVWLDAT
jgi:putative transposase